MQRIFSTTALILVCTVSLVSLGCGSSRPVQDDQQVNIGYGTQDAATVAGSVEEVDVEAAMRERPVARVSDILRGRTSGVIVREGPGGGISVRIRGSVARKGADPLYVIDGVPVAADPGGSLPWLNPHDIKSITVLKDAASTAIYGMRGGHGVIVITTKVGRSE